MMTNIKIWISLLGIILGCIITEDSFVTAARFDVKGPIVTITLRDPQDEEESSSLDATRQKKWLDWNALRPNAIWSLQSRGPPLPNWLPSLKSLRTTLGYNHAVSKNMPSHIDTNLRFSTGIGELEIQPSHQRGSKCVNVLVQATRGSSASLVARLSIGGRRFLQSITTSCLLHLPYSYAVGAIKIEPSYDFTRSNPKCVLEAITPSGRTKATLDLQMQDPTLLLVHALNERTTIAPEISLRTAKILYRFNRVFDAGSLQTSVNPTDAVHVTWTDRSRNGKWVTEFTLPLRGTQTRALAANVRVRRQFSF